MTTYTGILGKRELVSYVDPRPGKKGSDFGRGTCHRCLGSGMFGPLCVYSGRCFQCGGNGTQPVTVATLRKHARAEAYARDFADEIAEYHALRNWLWAEQAELNRQAELAAAIVAEEARLASLVQGFVAEVGDKVSGIEITVKVAKYCSGSYNRSATMFVIAEDADGKTIKFSGSATSVMHLERGDKATITTGKVKELASWNGQEQTVLSHVKVEIHEEVAA